MLARFAQICDDLLEASNYEGGNIKIERSQKLLRNEKQIAKLLAEIDIVTKHLQTKFITLEKCRRSIDVLQKSIADSEEEPKHPLHNYSLGSKYL